MQTSVESTLQSAIASSADLQILFSSAGIPISVQQLVYVSVGVHSGGPTSSPSPMPMPSPSPDPGEDSVRLAFRASGHVSEYTMPRRNAILSAVASAAGLPSVPPGSFVRVTSRSGGMAGGGSGSGFGGGAGSFGGGAGSFSSGASG